MRFPLLAHSYCLGQAGSSVFTAHEIQTSEAEGVSASSEASASHVELTVCGTLLLHLRGDLLWS